jgi:hypothetical protein
MEHIMFHWDDIVDLLVEELITEEVMERNNIEAKLMNRDNNDEDYQSSYVELEESSRSQ